MLFGDFGHCIKKTRALTCVSPRQRPSPTRADARGSDRKADVNRRELQGDLGGAPVTLGGRGPRSAPEQPAGVHGAEQNQTSGQTVP